MNMDKIIEKYEVITLLYALNAKEAEVFGNER